MSFSLGDLNRKQCINTNSYFVDGVATWIGKCLQMDTWVAMKVCNCSGWGWIDNISFWKTEKEDLRELIMKGLSHA